MQSPTAPIPHSAATPDASAAPPQPTLREKVYKGAAWTTLASLITQGLNMARAVLLASLLGRAEFGVSGMLLTVIGALSLLTNLGMGGVLLTRRFEDDEEFERYLNTSWTFEIVRSALLSLLLFAAATPTARFYGEDRLAPLLMVSALSPFLYSFHNIGLAMLRRDMNIARITQFDLYCGVAAVFFSVAFSWWLRSAWGIVLGNVAFSIFLVALSYRFHPYRPRLAFDRAAFADGFRFGKAAFVAGVMTFIATTADNVVVGKMLGAAALGTYMVAFSAASMPQRLVQGLLGSLLFPSFAAAGREGGERVEGIVSRAFSLGSAFLVLLLTPMFLLAREVITILFPKPEYQAAIPLLSVMLVGGLFRSLTQIISPLVDGLNRPDINAKSSTIEVAVFVSLLAILTREFGAMGAAWAGACAYALSFALRVMWCRPLAPNALAQLPATLTLALLCAGAGWGAGAFLLTTPWLLGANAWARAFVGSGVCLAVVALNLAIFFPSLHDEWGKAGAMVRRRRGAST